ncbi:MAG: hypothetical protein K5778_07810 [Bacteroidaceae bacterium]|nr:hypothetical protein [Bacteroidaceae bacterium]
MEFKEGIGWKACYDQERNLYTAKISGMGSTLLEITKDIYDALSPDMKGAEAIDLLNQGRKLYMSVCDRCGPPYTIVFDSDYEKLCPWAEVHIAPDEHVWSEALTDAAVELFASEEKNREQRRKKKGLDGKTNNQ